MVTAILKEMKMRKDYLENEPVETIYFGGGTPSLLNEKELNVIFEALDQHFSIVRHPEITLEANPDDLNLRKIRELATSPVNRLSIGIQSFFDEDLTFMNRAHSANEAERSLKNALAYFDNITVDLIYGTPGLSDKKWLQNIRRVVEFGVPHISSYALTVEDKTALHSFIKSGKIPPLDDEKASKQFYLLLDSLNNAGFIQYEISNFGKEGYFSKHNSSYWKGENYLGIGPSAHSFNGKERSWNWSNNIKYIKSIQNDELPMEVEELSIEDVFNERIMTGLRTIWGVSINKIEIEFGNEFRDHLLKNAEQYIDRGWLMFEDKKYLKVTDKGKFFVDGIASELFIVKS